MRPLATLLSALLFAPAIARGAPLPTGAATVVTTAPPPEVPLRGPRACAVTLDVYVAFGHPASTLAAELAARAVGPDVRELLHLTGDGPPGAKRAAEAALEAAAEDRFWPLFDRLVERAPPPGLEELERLGREAGLDPARLDEALTTHRHFAELDALGRTMRAEGHYPGEVRVNGVRLFSPSQSALDAAIRRARARAQLYADGGIGPDQLYARLAAETDRDGARSLPQKRLPIDLEREARADRFAEVPVRGAPLAPITVVVFSNLACASCVELEAELDRAIAAHPGAVREIWRSWTPAGGVASPEELAAEWMAAAEAQGRFWQLHDLALAQGSRRATSTAEWDALAREAGLDLARAARDRRLGIAAAAVERDRVESRRLGLGFGPSLVVDGIPLSGLVQESELESLLRSELDRGVLARLPPESRR